MIPYLEDEAPRDVRADARAERRQLARAARRLDPADEEDVESDLEHRIADGRHARYLADHAGYRAGVGGYPAGGWSRWWLRGWIRGREEAPQ